MIDLRCEYLSVRYLLKLNMSRLFRGSRSLTWHDNNMQGLPFPGAIKIVATMIHYCYSLIVYGKWREIICYRMINKTFYFSAHKYVKLLGILFILKLYSRMGTFTKAFCIWKRSFLKELFLEEVHFNAYMYLWLSGRPKLCALICRNFPCPQKFLAMRLHKQGHQIIGYLNESFQLEKSLFRV